MFFQIITATLLGIGLGIVTGLIPGVHVNLIAILLLSISGTLIQYSSPMLVSIIIIAMAVTHTFLDTIPSVFLGAPEAETALSILPGHKLLLQGKGVEAVLLTVIGSFGGLVLAIICSPFLVKVVALVYPYLQSYIGWILLLVCIYMILRDQAPLWAFVIFISSGVLGYFVLNLPQEQMLFPLLSGLFGLSMLLVSLKDKVNIPVQESSSVKTEGIVQALPCALAVGWIASFLPGLGPAQAAIIGSEMIKVTERGFLILVGALSTVNMVLSLVTFYVLDKARNGAIVTVSEIMSITPFSFVIFLTVAVVAGGFATILAVYLSKMFAQLISKVDYHKVCLTVIILVVVLVIVISGWIGFLVLVISTALGIIPNVKDISRSHMMGCLLIPVMIYFLF